MSPTTDDDARARGEALALRVYGDRARSALPPTAYEARFPPRALPPGAMVTRFAPSPTGFMHIGGVFAALINQRLARQTGGVFYLRIEDTDVKRAIPGALDTVLDALARFDLLPDEGPVRGDGGAVVERGAYGPYVQTARAEIYRDHAIDLVRRGLAYPCFCSEAQLVAMREEQTALKVMTGYYGRWARCRDLPLDAVDAALARDNPFVIRLRTPDAPAPPVRWKDAARGAIEMPANVVDQVLLKSDGIPTYHLAHAVDDHWMRTTHVIRGDEWLSSVPLHVQLFAFLGFAPPVYAHIAPIQKLERVETRDEATGEVTVSETRRKLSKRKDPEANVDYYVAAGVPERATTDYLLNIANSTFEPWRRANPAAPVSAFTLELRKLAPGGALSDLVKLANISQGVIARMDAGELYAQGLAWARRFDPALAGWMAHDTAYTTRALAIERAGGKNKRVVTFRDLAPQLAPFDDGWYQARTAFAFPASVPADERAALLRALSAAYDPRDSRDAWFEKVRAVAAQAGYAPDVKRFKAEPGAFKGHVGDVTMVLRVALTSAQESPDLYELMAALGPERVRARIARFSG